ncbi:hypothetical protein [Streptomyces sp. 039-1]|uniref:hypothetical protein n=1 Tax=Streptomyces sp. 039-1 TaxID=2789263 RepID=UPI0039F4BA63
MPSNDQPTDNHSQSDSRNKPELGPSTAESARSARLHTAWTKAWKDDGLLSRIWDDLFQLKTAGWHEIANWIKGAALILGASLTILIATAACDIAGQVLSHLSAIPAAPTGDGHGLWGTVDHPIRVFLAHQAAHLAVTPGALYAAWEIAGLVGLIGGFFGNAGARITWTVFGAGSLAMIWSTTPPGGRAAATGLAAFMWAMASIIALRGLTLRPVVHNHPPQYQFNPELHLHATITAPDGHHGRPHHNGYTIPR